jgi:hypothetical protein
VGDTLLESYPNIAPGVSLQASYAINNGPIRVVSTDGKKIIAAMRVIWKETGERTSYSELMGLPAEQLSSEYWFPWYNNLATTAMNQQFRFGERGQHLHDDRGVCGGDNAGELSQHCPRGEPAGELRDQQRADPGREHGREEDHRGNASDLEGDRGADELLGADGLAGGAVVERVLVPLVQQPGDDRDDPAVPLWERGQHLHDDRGVCGGDTAGELSQHCSWGEPAGELRHQQRTDPGREHGREEDHRGDASDLEGDRGADELLRADGLAGGAVVDRVLVPLVQQPGDDCHEPAVQIRRALALFGE